MRQIWLILLALGSPAYARRARFPVELAFQTTLEKNQQKFFSHEGSAEQMRPIWLHAGDSLSSAWASGSILRERLAEAEEHKLPREGDLFRDLLHLFPS